MKCDDCKNQTGYVLGNDECGAGSFFPYCRKGHWDGSGPDSQEEYDRQISMDDPWKNCTDYAHKNNKNYNMSRSSNYELETLFSQ